MLPSAVAFAAFAEEPLPQAKVKAVVLFSMQVAIADGAGTVCARVPPAGPGAAGAYPQGRVRGGRRAVARGERHGGRRHDAGPFAQGNRRRRGRIDSTSQAHQTVEHGFRRITVHFSIEGTLDTVTKTLAAIETARPALFADRVAIAAPEGDAGGNGPPTLHLDLEVSGYLARPRS